MLLGVFQLVGRTHLGRFLGGGESAWTGELRLWILVALSVWLSGTAAVRGPRYGRFPGDRTLVWAVMVSIFVTYMAATSLWAPDLPSATAKAYDLLFVAWACSLAAAALRLYGVRATIEGVWAALFCFGFTLAIAGLIETLAGNNWEGRVTALGSGRNVFGRNMALLTLAALRYMFDNRRWVRGFAYVAAPLASLQVLQSGSRGAMLALLTGVTVYLIIQRVDRRAFLSIVIIGLAGVVAMLTTQAGKLAALVFRERFIVLLLQQRYFSHRDTLLVDAIAAGVQNPVGGLGLAGFAQLGSPGLYPHNMFAEAFVEGGLVGLALLCLPFASYVRRWKRGLGAGDPATVAGLTLLLVSSSISGDLFDARGVFLLLLMAIGSQIRSTTRSAVSPQ